MKTKRKAFAYITRDNQYLLVFEHEGIPEAGIQVPAGRIEDGETPEQAVLREAQEETGLQNLRLVSFIGEQIRDMSDFDKNEIHHRYFYHLICDNKLPETWQHGERYPSGEQQEETFKYIFNFYWVKLSQPAKLIADHDFYADKLSALLLSDEKSTQQE